MSELLLFDREAWCKGGDNICFICCCIHGSGTCEAPIYIWQMKM